MIPDLRSPRGLIIWTLSFRLDEEGNVMNHVNGEPGYRFNEEASTEVKNRIEEALSVARHNMVSFKRSQRSDTASLIQEQAICNFLAGDAIEARTWAFKN